MYNLLSDESKHRHALHGEYPDCFSARCFGLSVNMSRQLGEDVTLLSSMNLCGCSASSVVHCTGQCVVNLAQRKVFLLTSKTWGPVMNSIVRDEEFSTSATKCRRE